MSEHTAVVGDNSAEMSDHTDVVMEATNSTSNDIGPEILPSAVGILVGDEIEGIVQGILESIEHASQSVDAIASDRESQRQNEVENALMETDETAGGVSSASQWPAHENVRVQVPAARKEVDIDVTGFPYTEASTASPSTDMQVVKIDITSLVNDDDEYCTEDDPDEMCYVVEEAEDKESRIESEAKSPPLLDAASVQVPEVSAIEPRIEPTPISTTSVATGILLDVEDEYCTEDDPDELCYFVEEEGYEIETVAVAEKENIISPPVETDSIEETSNDVSAASVTNPGQVTELQAVAMTSPVLYDEEEEYCTEDDPDELCYEVEDEEGTKESEISVQHDHAASAETSIVLSATNESTLAFPTNPVYVESTVVEPAANSNNLQGDVITPDVKTDSVARDRNVGSVDSFAADVIETAELTVSGTMEGVPLIVDAATATVNETVDATVNETVTETESATELRGHDFIAENISWFYQIPDGVEWAAVDQTVAENFLTTSASKFGEYFEQEHEASVLMAAVDSVGTSLSSRTEENADGECMEDLTGERSMFTQQEPATTTIVTVAVNVILPPVASDVDSSVVPSILDSESYSPATVQTAPRSSEAVSAVSQSTVEDVKIAVIEPNMGPSSTHTIEYGADKVVTESTVDTAAPSTISNSALVNVVATTAAIIISILAFMLGPNLMTGSSTNKDDELLDEDDEADFDNNASLSARKKVVNTPASTMFRRTFMAGATPFLRAPPSTGSYTEKSDFSGDHSSIRNDLAADKEAIPNTPATVGSDFACGRVSMGGYTTDNTAASPHIGITPGTIGTDFANLSRSSFGSVGSIDMGGDDGYFTARTLNRRGSYGFGNTPGIDPLCTLEVTPLAREPRSVESAYLSTAHGDNGQGIGSGKGRRGRTRNAGDNSDGVQTRSSSKRRAKAANSTGAVEDIEENVERGRSSSRRSSPLSVL